ncbi:MAG: hypothetical protein WCD89_21675 [Anaerocolumna sp.]
MENIIILELYNKSSLIEIKKIDINLWFDGDIEEIDNEDCRISKKITLIKGTQYDDKGVVEETWTTYYDDLGRLIKSERYDSSLKLIDFEEIKYDEDGRIVK